MSEDDDYGEGLILPATVGPSEAVQAQIRERWDTFDMNELEMSRLGFHPREKPALNNPDVTPDVLNDPNSRSYNDVFAMKQAWLTYATNIANRIKAYHLGIMREMNELEKIIRISVIQATPPNKKRPSKDQIKDVVESHPRYLELMMEQHKNEQQALIIKSHVDSLEADVKLLSRAVETRRQDWEAGRMTGNRNMKPSRIPGT